MTWHVVVHNFKRLFWWSEKGKLPHYLYIGRSHRACLLGLLYSHTPILSRSKQDRGSNTVFLPSKNTGFLSSPLVTDPDVSPSAGEGEEGQRLGRRRQRGRRPTAGRTVISGRAPAQEVHRSLRRCLGAGPAPAAHLSTSRRPSGISSFETALALLPQLAMPLHVHHFLPLSPSRSDGPTSHIFFFYC